MDRVRGAGGLVDEPSRDNLFIIPTAAAEHAIADPGQVAGRQADRVRGVPADLGATVEELEPLAIDADRPQEGLDGEAVVGHPGDRLADQRGVVEAVRRVAEVGAGVEGEGRGRRVAGVAEDVFPGAAVPGAGRLGSDPGGMIKQLRDGDLGLPGIAQRVGPGDEVEGAVVEGHPTGGLARPGSARRRSPARWRRGPWHRT